MKYLVSLNGKQYEVIVEHHTAKCYKCDSFVSERSPKESSIEQKASRTSWFIRKSSCKQHCCKGAFAGNYYKN